MFLYGSIVLLSRAEVETHPQQRQSGRALLQSQQGADVLIDQPGVLEKEMMVRNSCVYFSCAELTD